MKGITVSFQREDKLVELASDALLCTAVAELGDSIFEPGDRPHHGDASRLQARVAVSHGIPPDDSSGPAQLNGLVPVNARASSPKAGRRTPTPRRGYSRYRLNSRRRTEQTSSEQEVLYRTEHAFLLLHYREGMRQEPDLASRLDHHAPPASLVCGSARSIV